MYSKSSTMKTEHSFTKWLNMGIREGVENMDSDPDTDPGYSSLGSYPINIKDSYIDPSSNHCTSMCSYSFKYPTGSLIVSNKGSHLELTTENSTTSPVTYNNESYDVYRVHIVNKPFHYFNGVGNAGEMLIYHTGSSGATPLIVSIPLSTSGVAGKGSTSLYSLISLTKKNASNDTDAFTLQTTSFTLNDYLPSTGTSFYTYKGDNILSSSSFSESEVNYIVFEKGVYIDEDSIDNLKGCINSEDLMTGSVPTTTSVDDETVKSMIFYNKNGASSLLDEDEIYIDCKPTDSTGSELAFKIKPDSILGGITQQRYDFIMDMLKKSVVSVIIVLILWYVPAFITKYLNGGDIQLPFEKMSFGSEWDDVIKKKKRIEDLKFKKLEMGDTKWKKNIFKVELEQLQNEVNNLVKGKKDSQDIGQKFQGSIKDINPFGKGSALRTEARNRRTRPGAGNILFSSDSVGK